MGSCRWNMFFKFMFQHTKQKKLSNTCSQVYFCVLGYLLCKFYNKTLVTTVPTLLMCNWTRVQYVPWCCSALPAVSDPVADIHHHPSCKKHSEIPWIFGKIWHWSKTNPLACRVCKTHSFFFLLSLATADWSTSWWRAAKTARHLLLVVG